MLNRAQAIVGLSLVAVLAAVAVGVQWRSAHHVVRGGFWFDEVTFALPVSMRDDGGPLTEAEQRAIEEIARLELSRAYAGLRITFVDSADARYSVRVVQRAQKHTALQTFAAAESYSMGALGGFGTVDFEAMSSHAIGHAPPGAGRDAVIEGIGRGIGRATVHEFAHLLLSGVNLHAGRDPGSYEYARVSRAAQFYGPIHWDFARPLLLKRLGARDDEARPR